MIVKIELEDLEEIQNALLKARNYFWSKHLVSEAMWLGPFDKTPLTLLLEEVCNKTEITLMTYRMMRRKEEEAKE